MTEMPWAFVSALINTAELLVLIWLLIHLRHSAAPHQAALIEQQRRELDIVRGNLSRLSDDQSDSRREHVLAAEKMWEELRRIHARLDEMRCPIGHADCPLNGRKG